MLSLLLISLSRTPPRLVPIRVEKVSQVTGELDRERGKPADNRTESRFGLYGTDLGASFEHKGRLVFLFGDTWPVDGKNTPDRPVDGDAIAFSNDRNPDDGLKLDFVTAPDGKYQAVQIPGVSLKGFEVPNGGFSHNGSMYAFYTTDASWKPDDFRMSRSVMAKSVDGKKWELVHTMSTDKFANVSAWVTDHLSGLPAAKGRYVLMWGSSTAYRRSNPYLACVPVDKVEDHRAIRYWANGTWSDKEADATPLFEHPTIGELSVGWCAPIRKWMMLYNGNPPRGIHMRLADKPWGPWTESTIVFDPENGYGKFMHVSWKDRKADSVHDPWRENEYGGEYGPYMIPRFFKKTKNGVTIYYLMSIWNPYQVVLMRADLEWKK